MCTYIEQRELGEHLVKFVMVVLLSVADLAHVEGSNPANGVALVYLCGCLSLCLGEHNVQEILGCGYNRDAFKVIQDHGD